MGWSLSNDALREIDRIVRADVINPIGPEYMATPARAEDTGAGSHGFVELN
jgi:hypothetical protein